MVFGERREWLRYCLFGCFVITYMRLCFNKIILFWGIPLRYKCFFLLNVLFCGIARLAINTLALRHLSIYFGYFYKTTTFSTVITEAQKRQAYRIGQFVRLAAKYTPWDSSCLTQAMVAKFWCRAFKIPYILYIGFAKAPEEPSGYKGHAWLTAGPIAVTGGNGFIEFNVVSTYVNFFRKDGLCNTIQLFN